MPTIRSHAMVEDYAAPCLTPQHPLVSSENKNHKEYQTLPIVFWITGNRCRATCSLPVIVQFLLDDFLMIFVFSLEIITKLLLFPNLLNIL